MSIPVDYDALNKMVKRQRAALTRAVKSKNPNTVLAVCKAAVREWSKPGSMWPDDWSRWQRALDDSMAWGEGVRLEDLE